MWVRASGGSEDHLRLVRGKVLTFQSSLCGAEATPGPLCWAQMGAQDRQFGCSSGRGGGELGGWLPGRGEAETLWQEV